MNILVKELLESKGYKVANDAKEFLDMTDDEYAIYLNGSCWGTSCKSEEEIKSPTDYAIKQADDLVKEAFNILNMDIIYPKVITGFDGGLSLRWFVNNKEVILFCYDKDTINPGVRAYDKSLNHTSGSINIDFIILSNYIKWMLSPHGVSISDGILSNIYKLPNGNNIIYYKSNNELPPRYESNEINPAIYVLWSGYWNLVDIKSEIEFLNIISSFEFERDFIKQYADNIKYKFLWKSSLVDKEV